MAMELLLTFDRRFDAARGLALGVTMGAALWLAAAGTVWALLRISRIL
jgi:hypothetical protein